MPMNDKPKPIRQSKPKSHGWRREPVVGFITPRLNQSETKTEAFGFVDYREYEYDGGAWMKRKP